MDLRNDSMGARVMRGLAASSLILFVGMFATLAARAHEIVPAIGDLRVIDGGLDLEIRLAAEGPLAGIDLSSFADTNDAPQAADYDRLRALGPAALEDRFRAFWPEMAANIILRVDDVPIVPEFRGLYVPETRGTEAARISTLRIGAPLPPGSESLQIGWAARYGALVIRQMDVPDPYDAFLPGGTLSAPIALAGGGQVGPWQAFVDYVPVGFDHIVPKGLDHILFVLGLFFLSTRLMPLLWQVSAFTLAHTVTLAAGALGWVSVPGAIVEPLIAASIVFVAVENILSQGMSPWRPLVVFVFGLLHGLGFASVLEEFGIPEANFIPALLGFNVGVEVGQLAVIAVAFLAVGLWFRNRDWYRPAIAIPASVAIAGVGAWWFVERVFL